VAAERLKVRTGIEVKLVGFDSEESLNEKVLNGEKPSVVIGSHVLARGWADAGQLGKVHCEDGFCPNMCLVSNPPRICWYIQGRFSDGMMTDFPFTPERCAEPDCGECQSDASPLHCSLLGKGVEMDVLQASFSHWDEELGRAVPHGVPLGWTYAAIAVDGERLKETGQEMPDSTESVLKLVSITAGAYFDGPYCGNEPRKLPIPRPPGFLEPWTSVPRPAGEVPVHVLPVHRLWALQQELGTTLSVPVLADSKPSIMVRGAYAMGTKTGNPDKPALEFIAELASPDVQELALSHSGMLPGDQEALERAGGIVIDLMPTGLTGALETTLGR